MASVRAPFPYFGGKQLLVPTLLQLLPPHEVYVEPFGGAGSLLFSKRPAKVTVYNDLDSGVINFFRVLRDPKRSARLIALLELTPYAREEYIHCRDTWTGARDSTERARRWFMATCAGLSRHSGGEGGWSYSRTVRACSKSRVFFHTVAGLHEFIQTLRETQIDHRPALEVIQCYDAPGTLFYLDPPYLPTTRKGGTYAREMSVADHAALLELITGLRGMIILSGYHSALYDDALASWRCIHYQTINWSANSRKSSASNAREARTECIWLSPNAAHFQPNLL